MAEENNLEGLGGWLVLVGLGIVISPFVIIAMVWGAAAMIPNGTWAALTTPGAEAYHALWAPIILTELVVNCGMILAWFYIAYLFFTKKRAFPKWYIGILLFTLVFTPLDALAIKLVLPEEPAFDADTTKLFFRTLFQCLIWIPYMLVSKRVKATFVN